MSLSKVGFNISGASDLTTPDINITSNVTEFVRDIPKRANEYSSNWAGTGIMIALAFYLYYKLADISATGFFKYSQLRALALSFGITGFVGLVMYSIGYFRVLYPVVFFIIVFMICFIWIIKEERG